MEDPTIEFNLITFQDVRSASYSATRISRSLLRDRILFAHTNEGNYAKLQVQSGTDLRIVRLTVYNRDGCIVRTASNLIIRSSFSCDLDNASESWTRVDFWWNAISPSEYYLEPQNTAAFHLYEGFDDITFDDIRGAPFVARRVERSALGDQILFCQTSRGQFAKLLVEAGDTLRVRRLVVYRSDGSVHLDQSNIAVPRTYTLDVDTGNIGVTGYDLWWEVESLVRSDQWSTIQAVVDWCRANLVHITGFDSDPRGGPFASQADQYHYIYGYRGLPRVDKMIYPLPGRRHVTDGCWGTDGFLAAVLRTVNIPVRHGRTNFRDGSHSRAEFFTVGQNLAHGDDPYNATVRLGINNVPIHRIFYSDAQAIAGIDAPRPLPGKTVPETTSFNHVRRLLALAVEFKTNYLLYARCQDRAAGTRATRVRDRLREFYTDTQIARIVIDCDTAIAAIAGGCAAIHEV
jgi:hypothetical protein